MQHISDQASNPRSIEIKDYNYPLPQERIALHPLEKRDECKLLVREATGTLRDTIFKALPSLLPEDAVLVYNNTRVINARLRFRKASGAKIEIFCLEPTSPADYERSFAATKECCWSCLIGNSKRWKEGQLELDVTLPDGKTCTLKAERTGAVGNDGSPEIKFTWSGCVSFSEIIGAAGEIPIPPYLNRSSEEADSSDYQTIFSHIEGSVAAPTAGLHFTDAVLEEIDSRGIARRELTLHVGAGTFRPVKSDQIGEHDMHSEFVTVRKELIDELRDFIAQGRPVIAVGTTSVRTLESLYHIGKEIGSGNWTGELPQWTAYDKPSSMSASQALDNISKYLQTEGLDTLNAYTRIIIAPGYKYRIVSGMLTNFHQPQSTLLLLVSAFIGESWRDVYRHALKNGYRFLSYGDACLFMGDTAGR
ncbi:MAG: S-adenosylmethionine:tRNA ribosyltransferase-isomerase [Muribaculaceae bacterium]|nr:S-adenosylmethionine:tRNA ribosyltransferase-isomerase [Muribaculaceae bacterium]